MCSKQLICSGPRSITVGKQLANSRWWFWWVAFLICQLKQLHTNNGLPLFYFFLQIRRKEFLLNSIVAVFFSPPRSVRIYTQPFPSLGNELFSSEYHCKCIISCIISLVCMYVPSANYLLKSFKKYYLCKLIVVKFIVATFQEEITKLQK